ncbi:MAG: LytTR family DNA-binding domain-containing protein [Bacteroidota bacterium]
MLKVIVVDDEENVREALGQLLESHPEVTVCASCASLSSAVTAIKQYHPDILLLDIEIGKENGFDIFKHFPQPDFRVIFITAYQQYALQAFRFSALDYLLKPVDPDLLADALKKATDVIDKEKITTKIDSFLHNINDLSKDTKKIVLKTAETIHLVHLRDIMYCEADRSYTNFYLADKSRIMVSTTLGDYEELFNDYGFFRIHQSFLLNLSYFKRFEKGDGGKVILTNNSALPVATRKKDQFLQRLASL